MSYTKIGPFTNDSATPPIDKTFLDGIETFLNTRTVDGNDASTNFVPVWNGSAWTYAGIKNAQVDAAAAIAYSKLSLTGSIVNADIASAAAISVSKLSGAYSSFTPTWASTGTQPAIGNGSISGSYIQIGKFVHGIIQMNFGSTTTFGTGTYTLSMPVPMAGAGFTPVGHIMGVDASIATYGGMAVIIGGSTVQLQTQASPQTTFSATVPWTIGSGDAITVNFTYQAS